MTTNQTNQRIVIASFNDAQQAEQAVEALHDANFTSDQIRYSGQYPQENFLEGVKDLLIFPREAQDETQNDVATMLQNTGFSPKETQYYLNEFNSNHFVVIVRPDNREQEATNILRNNGGQQYTGQ
jgi:hypothetical protein